MTIHVVQPGETVASIAAGYGVDPVRLAADNSVDRGQLAVGQTLVIRFPRRVHAVQPGETLYSISQSYGVSLRQLWRNNWSLHRFGAAGRAAALSHGPGPLYLRHHRRRRPAAPGGRSPDLRRPAARHRPGDAPVHPDGVRPVQHRAGRICSL